MARNRTKSFTDDPADSIVDVFEAIKRARMSLGFFRQKQKPRLTLDESNHKKLVDVTINAHDVLLKANTAFPFTLFPDTVTLDREKLTFASRYFFGVAKISSIPIRDILSVEADIGPVFGSVHTSSRYFVTNPYSVRFMWRKDAIKLQRLVQGFIIAEEKDIDTTKIDMDKLIVMLDDLGRGDTS